MPFVSFPSIEGFHNVRKGIERYPCLVSHPLIYCPKIKLHGTNAGVQIRPNGEVFAQSRNRLLIPGDDNFGFAAWVNRNEEFFSKYKSDQVVTLFGEWCGSGILKTTAITKISEQIFAVFLLQVGESTDDDSIVVIEPTALRQLIGYHRSIYVLDWLDEYKITVDWHDLDSMQSAVDQVNKAVINVNQCDPFVEKTWGIKGIGEGLVYYPIGVENRKKISDLMFKAKGDDHKVSRAKKAAQVDPDVLANIQEFVTYFVTPARLEQGLMEVCQGLADMKSIGLFLAWVGRDVQKESVEELEASGRTWKQVNKAVTIAAREWFINKSKSF